MSEKFILLSSQRTGSAFLEQSLTSHSKVRCDGEVLLGYGGLHQSLPPRLLKKYRRLRTLWQAIASGAMINPIKTMEDSWKRRTHETAMGFRLMYNQIERDPRVRLYLSGLSDIKVINLRRRNLLKQFVSLKLMHNQTKFGRRAAHTYDITESVKIQICPSEAVSYIEKIKKHREKYKLFFSNLESIEVDYEDMIIGSRLNPEISNTICDFLNVTRETLTCIQKKINPNTLDKFVINHRELIDYVSKSGCGGESDHG